MTEKQKKIGVFAQQFGIEPETVRYYINKGLLVPASKNGRYQFSAQDEEDMRHLLQLKSLRFSLTDVHRILSLERLSNLDSAEELSDYIAIFRQQRQKLVQETTRLKEITQTLQHEIESAAGKHAAVRKKSSGVPLSALSLLACPHCQSRLTISNANIQEDQLLSGTLRCACGYTAAIREGVIIGEQGKVSAYDGPDLERNCYRRMSSDLVTLMQKDYLWLLEKLEEESLDGCVVLEDFVNDYCFCHANLERLDSKALYIITDKFPEIVDLYKNLIDRMNLPHQVLYIAAASHLLPLREGCVDLYFDFSANECAIFNSGYSMDPLTRYFHTNTRAMGSFWHFPPGCASLQELKRQYPENWEHNFDIRYFMDYLRAKWEKVRAFEQLGTIADSGEAESFSYHQPGDILRLTAYDVRGLRGKRNEN